MLIYKLRQKIKFTQVVHVYDKIIANQKLREDGNEIYCNRF